MDLFGTNILRSLDPKPPNVAKREAEEQEARYMKNTPDTLKQRKLAQRIRQQPSPGYNDQ